MPAAFEVLDWNDLDAALMGYPFGLPLVIATFPAKLSSAPSGSAASPTKSNSAIAWCMNLAHSLTRYPTDETVCDFVAQLRDGSPDFARL
ncbi:hypothetical protein CH262_25760 [Rhodococcus sp. 05-2255-1e]|nr:hypothetical protein CH262_25760 [Rhodococcus sp. 05-2255-1e]